ncbi:STAS domain-containing protein [Streptomyces sp. NPDC090106]|uniref:STAS domain-containing protein n=1 Tax=Streptomyces sp. NPDC090106 TaxID=3365946 RepID=UPI003820C107
MGDEQGEQTGEIDFDSSHTLLRTLEDALDQSADGLEVDLARISFCDCSGLNALLLIRQRACETAKTLTVRVSSPAVQHLLELTGTLDTLTATHPEQGAAPADDAVRTENDQLRRAMQTRPAIDIARGILMASYTLSAAQAARRPPRESHRRARGVGKPGEQACPFRCRRG